MAEKTKPESTDPIEQALWERVVEDWTSDEAHGAFIHHCRSTGRLAEAAERYRDQQGPVGETSAEQVREQVERRLAAIAALAVADLEATKQEGKRHRKAHLVLQVVAVVFFLVALALLVRALMI